MGTFVKKLFLNALLMTVATPALAATEPNATFRILDNVVFMDGTKVTGFFVFDATTRRFGEYDITTSDGLGFGDVPFAGNRYTSDGSRPLAGTFPSGTADNNFDYYFYADTTYATFINFQLDNPLTGMADVRSFINTDSEGGAPTAELNTSGGNFAGRVVTSGSLISSVDRPVAAVPEPATWAMMFLGFGMIGGAARYRSRKTNVAYA
jgi:hypothetical protein